MSTRRSTPPGGLSASDIDGIRSALEAGRKPKVMFTAAAGQIAGEVGQVVKLNDPSETDEWLVVRFGKDELPFTPADLTMPPRKARAKAATAAEPPKAPAAPHAQESPKATEAPQPPEAAAGESAQAAAPPPAKRASRKARPAKPKPPSALTVTLAYESGEWTVAAHQGSKTLAKPSLVRAAEALKLVGMLDVPGVHDAVEAIVTAELSEAAQRAEQLRGELAEVEARLAELRDVG